MASDPPEKSRLFASAHPLEALSLLALFGALILFITSVIQVYGIPYGIDFGEGYLANMSLEMIRGHNPYHTLDNPPWIVSSYPPLYPILNGLLTAVFGPSLLPGRFIATASLIGIIATAILLLRRLGATAAVSLLAVGILLAFPWPVRWAQVVRVDTMGILLAAGGLYWWLRSNRPGDAVVAAMLLAAAVFTKHSLIAAPLACLVHAFLTRDRRRVLLLLSLAVLIAGTYGLANLLTDGGLFLHLFNYTVNTYFPLRFAAGLGEYFKMSWIVHLLALSAFLMPGTMAGPRRLLGWYYLFAHLTLFAYGYEGSDTNYYIEPLLSASLVAGLALDRLTAAPQTTVPLARGLPSPRTLGFALILAVLLLARYVSSDDFRLHRMNPDRLRNGLELVRLAAGTPGDVLSEDASFTFLAGKPVLFQPYIMSLLERTGKWDEEPFLETIRRERYSIIVLRVDLSDPYNTERRSGAWEMAGFDRWTDAMEDAIMEHYSLHGGLDVGVGNAWYVYLPRVRLNDSQQDSREDSDQSG